jgi:hypothetical protein
MSEATIGAEYNNRMHLSAISRGLHQTFRNAPGLSAAAVFLSLLILPTLAAMAFDPRLHLGINIWTKPLKFEIALTMYMATLAVFATWIPAQIRQARWLRIYTGVVIAAIIGEILWIGGAAAIGTSSHFNTEIPLMALLYSLAGVAALILTSLSLTFGILVARNRETQLADSVHLSLWLGLCMTFVLTLIVAGYMSSQTSHLVGGNALDLESWRVTGWATDGGDLRIAHFFASHAMHVMPILGVALVSLFGRDLRVTTIAISAMLYTAFIAYAFVEAILGRPFLSTII